jgi:hypothetical protein
LLNRVRRLVRDQMPARGGLRIVRARLEVDVLAGRERDRVNTARGPIGVLIGVDADVLQSMAEACFQRRAYAGLHLHTSVGRFKRLTQALIERLQSTCSKRGALNQR